METLIITGVLTQLARDVAKLPHVAASNGELYAVIVDSKAETLIVTGVLTQLARDLAKLGALKAIQPLCVQRRFHFIVGGGEEVILTHHCANQAPITTGRQTHYFFCQQAGEEECGPHDQDHSQVYEAKHKREYFTVFNFSG